MRIEFPDHGLRCLYRENKESRRSYFEVKESRENYLEVTLIKVPFFLKPVYLGSRVLPDDIGF
jgi:hypothetical protein